MDKERITISINKEILKKIDEKIDGARIRNRSHAFESLVYSALDLSQIETAVIMAGGKSAPRLIPMILQSIENLKKYGFNRIYIAIGYLGDKIKQSIGNGTKFGIKIEYIEGGEGTAGALHPLSGQIKKSFLVINCDEYISINLKKLADFHQNHRAIATVATKDFSLPKGIYVFEPEIFAHIPKDFSMLEEDVFPKLAAINKLIFFPLFA